MVHFWLAVPAQVQICSRVPLVELLPVASRHLFAAGLTMSFAAVTVHCCAPVPLQSHNWIFVPSAVPAEVMSKHLPSAWIVPSELTDHCWAPVPLQSHNWIAVPLAVAAADTSTHLPARPVI